jgi:hypothetical protein
MTQFFLAMLLQQPTQSPGEEAMKQAIAKSIAEGRFSQFGQDGPFGWPGVLIPTLSTLGFFALIALIGWLVYRRSQARTLARTEFHRQLLDKFTSGGEFGAFLNSSGGQRLLEDLWSQRVNAKERIIRSMQAGVVLTVLGLGMVGLSIRAQGMIFPGALVLALGAGFLISTAISYGLSKKLGLLQEQSSATEPASRP